jgi:hypothetical protein
MGKISLDFESFTRDGLDVLESFLLEPEFISVSKNRLVSLAIRRFIIETRQKAKIGGEEWLFDNMEIEKQNFIKNEEFINGFEIDPMVYMKHRLIEIITLKSDCNFLEAFETLILVQKVTKNIMTKRNYYRTCWSLVDTFFEYLNNELFFEKFSNIYPNGWVDLILNPEKMEKIKL